MTFFQKIITALLIIFALIWIFAAPGPHGAEIHGWITGLFAFFHGLAGG